MEPTAKTKTPTTNPAQFAIKNERVSCNPGTLSVKVVVTGLSDGDGLACALRAEVPSTGGDCGEVAAPLDSKTSCE